MSKEAAPAVAGMKTLTMEEILKETTELAVEYIVFNGYYSSNGDPDEIHKHTYVTETLYNKAFNETNERAIEDNADTFSGVCFDPDGKPLAEWLIVGDAVYFNIE